MNEAIQTYIDGINLDWQVEICRKLDEIIHEAIPGVESRLQYRKPHYLKNSKYVAVFATAKGWVSFTIFNATELEPPAGLFESSDTGDRITIKIKDGVAVDYDLLTSLVKQASDMI